MGIEQALAQLWEIKYERLWQEHAEVTKREFPMWSSENHPMVMVHNTLRDYYESVKKKQAQEREKSGQKSCPLDEERSTKDSIKYGNLLFRMNGNPTLEYHLFAQTAEHREHPTQEDHLTIMDFVDETDYAVFLNLRGSGAGIPDHLHYQGHKRVNFPFLLKLGIGSLRYNRQFEIWSHDIINYTLELKYTAERGKEAVSEYIAKLDEIIRAEGLSYNLLFDKNRVYLFPRTMEIAENIHDGLREAGMDKWQIAGQEMGYLFTAKYKQILEKMTAKALANALRDVTLSDPEERQQFEKLVLGVL